MGMLIYGDVDYGGGKMMGNASLAMERVSNFLDGKEVFRL